MSNTDEGEDFVKLILVGDAGVGKTCIISRLCRNVFEKYTSSTIGAMNSSKNIELSNGKTLKLNIWDTSGQELYAPLNKIFFRESSIAILVYDITRKESYERLKSYWYEEICSYTEQDIVIGIAGTKCDLLTQEEVSEEEARDFAKSIGAEFSLVSSLSGVGIDELFVKLGEKYINSEFSSKLHDENNNSRNNNISLDEKNTDENVSEKKNCC